MLSRLREWLRPKIVIDASILSGLSKGDVLVLTCPSYLDARLGAHLKDSLGALLALTGAKAIVLEGGCRLMLEPAPQQGDERSDGANNQRNHRPDQDVAAVLPQPIVGGIERTP